MSLLSIVLPAYNEEQNIANTAKVLGELLEQHGIDYELVFISDGSKDGTFERIKEESARNPRVRGAEFSRKMCIRDRYILQDDVTDILITTGGGDKDNIAGEILRELCEHLSLIHILDTAGELPEITDLVMSCRVMGRNIENAVIDRIEEQMQEEGYTGLRGRYIPTAKNKPVEALYEKLGRCV